MSFTWFPSCSNIDELKKMYRKLIMEWHPDVTSHNKDTATENMKRINCEYELAFNYLFNHATQDQQKAYGKAGHDVNDGYREILEKIIHIPEIIIELCGSWIWISGNTKPVKNQLKSAGFWWASKKAQWYWRPAEFKQSRHKPVNMDYIREKYGSERVYNKPYTQVEDQAI